MNYSKHRILKSGHIELRENSEDGFHRSVIAPNQPLEKYNEIIEADPNFEAYRTDENADTYEAMLQADHLSESEQLEQWRNSASLSRGKFMLAFKRYPFGDTTLKVAVDNLLNQMREDHPEQVEVFEDLLEDTTIFTRMSPDIIAMATQLQMTPEQVDDFFEYADKELWRNE